LTSSSAGSLPAVTASRGATSSASPPEVRGKYKQIDSNVDHHRDNLGSEK
jgi:hypothetical protein